MTRSARNFISSFIFCQWCLSPLCYAQHAKLDTAFLAKSKKQSIARYTHSTQNQSGLYNGSEYLIYQSAKEEHPYLESDDWIFGSVVYEGDLYENVPLLYDLSVDKVITEHNSGNAIRLVDEKIQRFSILKHTFIRLKSDSANKITEGFYDQLYNGQTKAYSRYVKTRQESLENMEVIPRFEENTQYYIVKNGIYFTVKTKGTILKVFSDRKQDIKDFIRKNHIRFKSNRVEAIVRIAEFYDTPKN